MACALRTSARHPAATLAPATAQRCGHVQPHNMAYMLLRYQREGAAGQKAANSDTDVHAGWDLPASLCPPRCAITAPGGIERAWQ